MKKYLAESIGTFALVFCGTGAIVINQETANAVSHVGIAATFGLIVAAMIYTIGGISGAHLNPAVSLAFYLARVFPGRELLPYILAQATGAFAATGLLHVLFPSNNNLGVTSPSGSCAQSFILEIILSFLLMFTIIHLSKGSKEQGMFAGMAIGSVVLLEAMFAGPISGASMNPIRSLSPALISGHTEHLWLYLMSSPIGMGLAVFAWKILRTET